MVLHGLWKGRNDQPNSLPDAPLKTLRVADSVRVLAGRTRQSAGEIEGTIDQLLQVTTQVVDEVQSGLVLIEDSLHLSHWNNPR